MHGTVKDGLVCFCHRQTFPAPIARMSSTALESELHWRTCSTAPTNTIGPRPLFRSSTPRELRDFLLLYRCIVYIPIRIFNSSVGVSTHCTLLEWIWMKLEYENVEDGEWRNLGMGKCLGLRGVWTLRFDEIQYSTVQYCTVRGVGPNQPWKYSIINKRQDPLFSRWFGLETEAGWFMMLSILIVTVSYRYATDRGN